MSEEELAMCADLDFAVDLDRGVVQLLGDGGTLVAELSPEQMRTLTDMAIDVLGTLEGREFYLGRLGSRR